MSTTQTPTMSNSNTRTPSLDGTVVDAPSKKTTSDPVTTTEKTAENKENHIAVPPAPADGEIIEDDAAEKERLANMPTGARLYLIMCGLLMAVYVVSLDQTIVAPAIPVISNDFRALADVGWYGSAYFATSTALQPLYGRLYRLNLKWPYLSCIFIFEIGSLICALAKDSKTFIVGRAIAGVGVAGGYIGTLTIIAASVPLNQVPVWSGYVGAVYGVGAITGPLIGGVFTSEVTWRWCFWLSLPLGGVTLLVVFFFFKPVKRTVPDKSILSIIWSLDLVGTALSLGAIVCYLLALQDGGLSKPWSSSNIIGLLVGFGVIIIAFLVNEWFMKDDAIIPLRILFTRGIGFSSIANFGIGASYFSAAIFLPTYFQLQGDSAIRSGVRMLPLVCGVIVSVTLAGGSAPKVGYVQPYLYVGCVLAVIGSGLFQLFDETTRQAFWVGITFMYGFGIGAAFQMPFIYSQTLGKGMDTEIGSSVTIFMQTLGGCLVVAACQAIYGNELKNGIVSLATTGRLQGVTAESIIALGQTGFVHANLPAAIYGPILAAALSAIRKAFIPTCVFIGLTLVTTVPLKWNSIKGMQAGAGGA